MEQNESPKRSTEIKQFIFEQVAKASSGITASIVEKFQISRQAAARYLQQMVEEGQLMAEGTTKDRVYRLGTNRGISRTYDLGTSQEESQIWLKDFKVLCEGLNPNIVGICEYGFTEIVNNAIDHSNGRNLSIMMARNKKEIVIGIWDDGIGIFRKIKDVYHLADEHQAILELSKGKLTTDPENHSGQGIFFSSKAFDTFTMDSHGMIFGLGPQQKEGVLFNTDTNVVGTKVTMYIDLDSTRLLKNVFDEFTDQVDGSYLFDKTIVSVKLVQYEGETLVSRSQAKRLMSRVENFRTAELDFEGIQSVGQAFADEIFRVYKLAHPNVELYPVHASDAIIHTILGVQFGVLDTHFENVDQVEQLIGEGVMAKVEEGSGIPGPNGEAPNAYRIVKKDKESLKRIWPRLLPRDREKITIMLGDKWVKKLNS